ncbi:MAG: hypothetical protein COA42_22630, partial [Alteromonadaceae bacterium]
MPFDGSGHTSADISIPFTQEDYSLFPRHKDYHNKLNVAGFWRDYRYEPLDEALGDKGGAEQLES